METVEFSSATIISDVEMHWVSRESFVVHSPRVATSFALGRRTFPLDSMAKEIFESSKATKLWFIINGTPPKNPSAANVTPQCWVVERPQDTNDGSGLNSMKGSLDCNGGRSPVSSQS